MALLSREPPGREVGAARVEPGELDAGEGEPVGRVVPDVDLAPLEQAAEAVEECPWADAHHGG